MSVRFNSRENLCDDIVRSHKEKAILLCKGLISKKDFIVLMIALTNIVQVFTTPDLTSEYLVLRESQL